MDKTSQVAEETLLIMIDRAQLRKKAFKNMRGIVLWYFPQTLAKKKKFQDGNQPIEFRQLFFCNEEIYQQIATIVYIKRIHILFSSGFNNKQNTRKNYEETH